MNDPAVTPPYLARDLEIAALYRTGKTLHEVAVHFGLTHARVWQCLRRQGLTRHDGGAAVRARQRRNARIAEKRQKLLAKLGALVVADERSKSADER